MRLLWQIKDQNGTLWTNRKRYTHEPSAMNREKYQKEAIIFFFRTKLNADDSLLWKDEAMFVYVCVSVDRKTNFVRFHWMYAFDFLRFRWMYASGCVQYFLGKV